MPRLRPHCRKIKGALLLTGLIPTLAGCTLADLWKPDPTNYSLSGSLHDPETQNYLDTIIRDNVRSIRENFSDEELHEARQQDYLQRRIESDLEKGLRARGYYDGQVTFTSHPNAELSGKYYIDYGPQYRIASLRAHPEAFAEAIAPLEVKAGDILDAQDVLNAQAVFYRELDEGQCYFTLDVENEVYLDRHRHEGDVRFMVEAGEAATFGPVTFKGNKRVKESYLRRLIPWHEGRCFRRERIEDYKTRLLQSGLFSRAIENLPDQPEADGSVPIVIDVQERNHRTLRAGVTYYSDEGPGIVLGWQHRNVLGEAEKLDVEASLSPIKQNLRGDFTKPYFLRNDQSLTLSASLGREDTDAYEELGSGFSAALKRTFNRRLSGTTGVKFSLTRIEDHTTLEKNTYGLVSFPQTLNYDSRDDTLDPKRGFVLNGNIEPFVDAFGESDPFFKTQVTGSFYQSLNDSGSVVLASRGVIGSLWGADHANIPATQRFYAGGGGSVRGFGYQEVGPKIDGNPTGGNSIVNFSTELRARIVGNFGAAAFIDGASISEESTPDFSKFAIGAGLGARYYTGFGPIRFDIATPLTEKDNTSRSYQFYISIGQAF